MNKLHFLITIFLINFSGCSSLKYNSSAEAVLHSALNQPTYCTLIYHEQNKEVSQWGDASYCNQRSAALGTFQVPLALMSFDAGVLPNEQVRLSWDGLKRAHPEWNKDHSASTWMRYSVSWYGQRLAKLLGPEKMQSYVDIMNFGNKDLSGGLATAWLPGNKESKSTNTLKISPQETLQFWNKFWQESFDLDKKSFSLTKRILARLPPSTDIKNHKVWGQNTAGVLSYNSKLDVDVVEGHFVGRIENKQGHYHFVTFVKGQVHDKSWNKFQKNAKFLDLNHKDGNELDLAAQLAEEVTWGHFTTQSSLRNK
jgi:beta-lactamase class D